jgi:hypothetical protein
MDIRSNRWGNVASAVAVFVIAVAVRLPSCYESFWVDELHSAWCVWDSLAEVAPRAKLGNQSPFYFVGLWFWKQILGGGEVAMRLSSVLFTSAAAVVMSLGVNRWTGSRIGGVAAGLVMALESNAIFFGTELRPYAVVILCASIATICFVDLLAPESSQRAWNLLGCSILVSLAAQPTSLAALVWFPVLVGLKRLRERRIKPRFIVSNLVMVSALAIVAWALWTTTLGKSWQSRGNWSTFAVAPAFIHAIAIWDWTWLWALPLVVSLFVPGKRSTLVCIALVVVSVVGMFWIASRLDWVHLWHRRYMVSLLPMFALLVGGAMGHCRRTLCGRLPVSVLLMASLVTGLTVSQGVLQTLCTRPNLLAYRGENWRSAVGWVHAEKDKGDQIWLDPGLIESGILVQSPPTKPEPTIDDLIYLRYPVSGPYGLQNVRLMPPIAGSASAGESFVDEQNLDATQEGSLWIISRASYDDALQFASKVKLKDLSRRFGDKSPNVRSFGGVSVIRLETTELFTE